MLRLSQALTVDNLNIFDRGPASSGQARRSQRTPTITFSQQAQRSTTPPANKTRIASLPPRTGRAYKKSDYQLLKEQGFDGRSAFKDFVHSHKPTLRKHDDIQEAKGILDIYRYIDAERDVPFMFLRVAFLPYYLPVCLTTNQSDEQYTNIRNRHSQNVRLIESSRRTAHTNDGYNNATSAERVGPGNANHYMNQYDTGYDYYASASGDDYGRYYVNPDGAEDTYERRTMQGGCYDKPNYDY
ncbi:hypothetical protein N0V86_006026 [Didymella sp. IMI 355093]|nr:hypothetical protein N0V86_006026 [Didymella sp. IMI 355093]